MSQNTTSEIALVSRRVREAIELLFSDRSLPRDIYLLKVMNKEGYVELKEITDFNRIQKITTDRNLIINALSKSFMLELDSQKTYVRRRIPFIPTKNHITCTRTVFAKGFPLDDSKSTPENIKKCFEKFGKVVYVGLNRVEFNEKLTGSAFIEFDSEEPVEKLTSGKVIVKFSKDADEDALILKKGIESESRR